MFVLELFCNSALNNSTERANMKNASGESGFVSVCDIFEWKKQKKVEQAKESKNKMTKKNDEKKNNH